MVVNIKIICYLSTDISFIFNFYYYQKSFFLRGKKNFGLEKKNKPIILETHIANSKFEPFHL